MANMFYAPGKCHWIKIKSDMHVYALCVLHSCNSPLLHCNMFLHYWKLGNNTGGHRENIGCISVVSSFFMTTSLYH